MKIKSLKYQVSCFGEDSAIDPTPENIKRSVDCFMGLGFLPGSVQEIDAAAGGAVQRLSVQNAGTGTAVNFITNRVDILKQVGFPGVTDCGSVEEFVGDSLNFLRNAEDGFKLRFNRVSLVCEYMVSGLSNEVIGRVRNYFLPNQPVNGGAEPFEWDARFASRVKFDEVNGETVNVIVSIGRHEMQIFEPSGLRVEEALLCQIDINTDPRKAEYRFGNDLRGRFYSEALKYRKEVFENILEVVNG